MATTNRTGDFNLMAVFKTPKGFYGIMEGRLTRDATLSKNRKDEDVVSIGLATGEKKNPNRFVSAICRRAGMDLPENVEIENFLNCTIKGKLGEEFSQEGKKGDHVIFAGHMSTFNDTVFLFPYFITLTKWVTDKEGKSHPEAKFFGKPPVFTSVRENQQDIMCIVPGTISYVSDIYNSATGTRNYAYARVNTETSMEMLYAMGINAYNKENEYSVTPFTAFVNNIVRRNENGELIDTGENRLYNHTKKGTQCLFIGVLSRKENKDDGTISHTVSVREFSILSGGAFGKSNQVDNNSTSSSVASSTSSASSASSAPEPDIPASSEISGDFMAAVDEEDELPF